MITIYVKDTYGNEKTYFTSTFEIFKDVSWGKFVITINERDKYVISEQVYKQIFDKRLSDIVGIDIDLLTNGVIVYDSNYSVAEE